ncbi:MAG: MucR family transcriptional regulator [Caulobacteraceae bacterium]|nr:MucR family transcriptional regulator [Caulobacter sp.]
MIRRRDLVAPASPGSRSPLVLETTSVADDAEHQYDETLELTAAIVAAYVGNASHVQASELPELIRNVRQAMREGGEAPAAEASESSAEAPTRAQIKKSVTPDALISFVDNKPYKTLKRHLTRHGMDMAEYRRRYGLPADYPAVAPNYSAARSEMARKLGLGARGRAAAQASKA